jgi:asparagine synthase (glutamine-hydrolysing)
MCGICGYVEKNVSRDVAMDMVMTMQHRGPDNQSVKVYAENRCVLGHARLSIIDLSESANQPMEYGDYAIVFNGEIYNFREIKKELAALGHKFLLDSDTEVILHAYEQWGKSCVDRFVGMFAFAILDRKQNRLTIMRDRAGIKPLYYYVSGSVFLFASEMKAFYKHPAFEKKILQKAVGLYFKYGYVPAPYAIFQNTWKLLPGHILEYDIAYGKIEISKYWDVTDYYKKPRLDITYEEAKKQLEGILQSAFDFRMVADVPVGVFLSGGYDSALLTALLQKGRTEKVKTFTIGFDDQKWNEAPAAREVAKLLGTDHTEYVCTQDDCKNIIPELPFYYDEPFSDNSAVPTILVSRLARKDVKVALSADGGDETFAGYNRYAGLYGVLKYLNMLKPVKSGLLSHMAGSLSSLVNPYSFYREKGEYLSRLLKTEQKYRVGLTAEGGAFSTLSETMYGEISSLAYPDPMYLLDEKDYSDPISLAMAMDYINYMPNDILVKVDRATMSTSLEGRDPLLDHRIIEFAAQLPISYKFDHGNKKRIYKDILYQYVPKAMMDRPKSGFMMPVDEWLRGDLKYLLEENLDATLSPEFFNVENVKKMKSLFYQNKLGHENKTIWRILEFQLWYKYNM